MVMSISSSKPLPKQWTSFTALELPAFANRPLDQQTIYHQEDKNTQGEFLTRRGAHFQVKKSPFTKNPPSHKNYSKSWAIREF